MAKLWRSKLISSIVRRFASRTTLPFAHGGIIRLFRILGVLSFGALFEKQKKVALAEGEDEGLRCKTPSDIDVCRSLLVY